MLLNLKAEMARKCLTARDLARVTGLSETSIRNKLAGRTVFTVPEAIKIKVELFPEKNLDLQYLFEEVS